LKIVHGFLPYAGALSDLIKDLSSRAGADGKTPATRLALAESILEVQLLIRSVALVALACVLAANATRADEPILTELLSQPAYHAAWNAMLAGEQDVAPWIMAVGDKGEGVSDPTSLVVVEGQQDRLGWVCKPHDCGDHQLFVLFSPHAAQAWAVFTNGQAARRWFGKPGAAVQAALITASHR
jgi:Inhibitor of vertebrate lysozyme (Ivy)